MTRRIMLLVALFLVPGLVFAQMSEDDCFDRGGFLDHDGNCIVELELSLRLDQPTVPTPTALFTPCSSTRRPIVF